MKIYKHYIWDFDGTLFDSYPHSAAALFDTARFYGVDVSCEAIDRAIRHSFASAFELVGLSDEQLRRFHRLRGDDDFPPPVVPFPHAGEVLRALSERGASHYLYTHGNWRMSARFLVKYGLDGWFTDFMTADAEGFTRKPDPGAIRFLMEKWRIDPASAVMVGDREIDMACARAAGIDGILVDPAGDEDALLRILS